MALLKNLSYRDYAALPGLNISTLKYMRKSALHCRYAQQHRPADTPAMALGRAAHTAILEPHRLLAEYVLWEGGRRAGKEWEKFKADAGNKQILNGEEYGAACAMRDAVRGNNLAMRYLTSGDAEVSITFERAGVSCKMRADWLADMGGKPLLVGLKTAREVGLWEFGRQAANLGYHNQWEWYAYGYEASEKKPPVETIEIVVENTPPHDVAVYRIPPSVFYVAGEQNEQALEAYKAALASGVWPGQQPEETDFELPAWANRTSEDDDKVEL